MDCEMCGAKTKLFKTKIEGTEMNVCRSCSRYGEILAEVREPKPVKKSSVSTSQSIERGQIIQGIVKDYPSKIKTAREKLNLTHKEFARKINEKESVIHKLETGAFEPNFPLARKLEKFLKIKLVERFEEENTQIQQKTKSDTFTLGDFIKIKKK